MAVPSLSYDDCECSWFHYIFLIYHKLTEPSKQAPIVPLPAEYNFGDTEAILASPFLLSLHAKTRPVRTFLRYAWSRYRLLLKPHRTNKKVERRQNATLPGISIHVDSSSLHLGMNTDESYVLTVPPKGYVTIEASTVYGALRGMETFSQLVRFDARRQRYSVKQTPWRISDEPRFSHRGILLDTSRHYHSIPTIERFIDSLSYAKLNVFHWHIVDTQSFPLHLHDLPELSRGAYSPDEIYTPEDVQHIVEYARRRGVRVIPEFDTPGHAGSWCKGYPEICPSKTCTQPLNPSTNETFDFIKRLVASASELFPDDYIHLGGDEVDTKCWKESSNISSWMKKNHLTEDYAYKYFIEGTHRLSRTLGRKSIHWEEVFNHFHDKLAKDTIFQIWLKKETIARVVAAGYKCIVSNSDSWYLDWMRTTWEKMYENEPLMGIREPSDQKLVLGGEACLWSELVDDSDLFNTLWPRAAAVAERLWSPGSVTSKASFQPRLKRFRCLLNKRGIGAAAVDNKQPRSAPPGPGSCYEQ